MPATGEFIETGPVIETLPTSGAATRAPVAAPARLDIPTPEPTKSPEKPVAPAKPQRARDRMFADLEKRANLEPEKPQNQPTDEKPPPTSKPGETPKEGSPEAEGQADSQTPAATGEKGKKESPWKIVEQYKERSKKLEAEVAELRGKIAPETDFKAMQTRAESAEKKLEAAEEFIRLHSYQHSEEFRTKYHEPWEAAWKKAAKQMSEIVVTDAASGQQRQATVQDMELLVNSPLGRARQIAEELFGNFANDAMTMRQKIIDLYEVQRDAIENAKKTGVEREKSEAERISKETAKLRDEVSKTWATANQEVVSHEKYGHYFRPREGDQEWNARLAKGTELVDRAFATLKPDFSGKEPRADIIKRHAVMRHRAIAFGALRHENEALRADRDAWRKKYEAISKSAPAAGTSSQQPSEVSAPSSARNRLYADLEKIAHPS